MQLLKILCSKKIVSTQRLGENLTLFTLNEEKAMQSITILFTSYYNNNDCHQYYLMLVTKGVRCEQLATYFLYLKSKDGYI